jgi:DNA invertase Pin-like site-specific DNA recombinase
VSDKTAALYLRQSDDNKRTGENVEDQLKGTTGVAERLGLTVDKGGIYNDNVRPASDPDSHPRTEFERMLGDAAQGRFCALIVRHVDRLYRHPSDRCVVSWTDFPR